MDGRTFSFSTDSIELKSEDGNEYVIGYISTHERDRVNDVVTKNCMLDMLSQFKDGRIKLDFEHESLRGETDLEMALNITRIPLGKSISAMYDGTGISVKFMLNPEWKKLDQKGNVVMDISNIKNNIKSGMLDAFSIAYIPTKTAFREAKDGIKERLLDKLNLVNAALTGNAINIGARMTDIMLKSLDHMRDIESKPFAGYANFKECVRKNPDKKDPEAYCASIMRKVEGKDIKDDVNDKDRGGSLMTDTKEKPEDAAKVQGKADEPEDKPADQPEGQPEGQPESQPEGGEPASEEQKQVKALTESIGSMDKRLKDLEAKASKIQDKDVAKEIKSEIDKMSAQMKAFMEAPQYKAVSEQMEKHTKGEGGIKEMKGPLDLI